MEKDEILKAIEDLKTPKIDEGKEFITTISFIKYVIGVIVFAVAGYFMMQNQIDENTRVSGENRASISSLELDISKRFDTIDEDLKGLKIEVLDEVSDKNKVLIDSSEGVQSTLDRFLTSIQRLADNDDIFRQDIELIRKDIEILQK